MLRGVHLVTMALLQARFCSLRPTARERVAVWGRQREGWCYSSLEVCPLGSAMVWQPGALRRMCPILGSSTIGQRMPSAGLFARSVPGAECLQSLARAVAAGRFIARGLRARVEVSLLAQRAVWVTSQLTHHWLAFWG